MLHLLKFILFWPICILQFIILFPIHLVTTLFSYITGNRKGLLIELARRRDLAGMEILVLQGHNVNEKNAFGQTPLHGVFFDTAENSIMPYMAIKTLEFLICEGADVNIVDRRNWSPLMYAIGADYTDESIYLINTKKILLNKRFYEGRTALHYAVIKNNSKVVTHLLEKGVAPHIRDSLGLKPIDYCNNVEVRNLLLDKCSSY